VVTKIVMKTDYMSLDSLSSFNISGAGAGCGKDRQALWQCGAEPARRAAVLYRPPGRASGIILLHVQLIQQPRLPLQLWYAGVSRGFGRACSRRKAAGLRSPFVFKVHRTGARAGIAHYTTLLYHVDAAADLLLRLTSLTLP